MTNTFHQYNYRVHEAQRTYVRMSLQCLVYEGTTYNGQKTRYTPNSYMATKKCRI